MKFEKTPLQDCLLVHFDRFVDTRGVFTVRHSEAVFSELGLVTHFVQDNHSRSKPGVLRGMHYQTEPSQGKLVSVIRGQILDVVVDLRTKSPTYKKTFSVHLSESEPVAIWVPRGFAHGFCVLGEEEADVVYKVDAPYAPKSEAGFRYDDPLLSITWPNQKMILNEKDLALPSFEAYLKNPVF